MFMSDVHGLFNGANEVVRTAIAEYVSSFAAILQREDLALEQIRKSALTEKIAELDTRRDNVYYGLMTIVKAFHYSPHPYQVEMAKRIQIVLNHYGDFRRKGYNEESAIIINMVQDLNSRVADDLTQLNINDWVTDLSMANQELIMLMGERYNQGADVQMEDIREVRSEIDGVYQQITTKINALVVINGTADYADFINKMNERITYYKNAIAQRKGRAEAERKKKEEKEQAAKE